MDSDAEFLKEWDMVPSACENEKGDHHENHNVDCSTTVTENETLIENSGVQDIDQEAAVHESSSSDIDVIDENVDECATSCVLPSSSLSITPTIDKSSSTSTENSIFSASASESSGSAGTKESEANINDERNANERHAEDPWIIGGRDVYDWIHLLLEFLRNMSGWEWSVVFAVTMLLYVNITVHQTNTLGVEKEEVLSQMKKIVDELKHDNKILKSQMLSEIQNEKVISSFEHQIQELKIENSKLNHMLKDVVTVLQKQKDSQEKLLEKKESEYQAPLKKEINKLKEHINMLKFDNEELQKQLVRMRYASYSQGGKHFDSKDKSYEKKKEKHTNERKKSLNDISLDIEHLKKWNELITLLAKELGISDEGKHAPPEEKAEPKKESSKTEFKYDWGWKMLKRNFKDTLNFPNINISDFISKYVNYNVQTMSDLYDTVNKYFNSAQENAQEVLKSFKTSDEETEMLKFLKSLKEYWAKMKNQYFKSFVKKDFQSTDKDFKTPESAEISPESPEHLITPESDSQSYKDNMKPEAEEFDKKSNVHYESNDKVQSDLDESKWVFKRAEYRAQRRHEDESSINWFLRRGKELFEGKAFMEDNNEDMPAEE